jgi:hypothetical protein
LSYLILSYHLILGCLFDLIKERMQILSVVKFQSTAFYARHTVINMVSHGISRAQSTVKSQGQGQGRGQAQAQAQGQAQGQVGIYEEQLRLESLIAEKSRQIKGENLVL